MFLTEDEILMG